LGRATGDPKAIELAQRVVDASGGKKNFDNIQFLSFDYFGRRYWFWDKPGNGYRVESEPRQLKAAGKLDGSEFNLWLRGQKISDLDTISKYRDWAYRAWINDTYWLLFPFKLLDPGVHLKYIGHCIADSSINATCIELTFDSVGVTPLNKYIAYIDSTKAEVIYWDYFENRTDSLPEVSNSWHDYKWYDNLKIAAGRGDDSLKEIRLHQKLPNAIFQDVSQSYNEILKLNQD
jgi:hypothetical protein